MNKTLHIQSKQSAMSVHETMKMVLYSVAYCDIVAGVQVHGCREVAVFVLDHRVRACPVLF